MSLVIDVGIFALAFIFLVKKPCLRRVALFVCVFAVVHIAQDIYSAYTQGISVYEMYLQNFDTAMQEAQNTSSSIQPDQLRVALDIVALCWVGVQVMSDAFLVLIVLLFARYINSKKRVPAKVNALSKVDLKIWSVYPLIAGVVLLAVSFIPQVPERETLYAIALNVLIISTLPLFVQGAAACKGIMNNLNLAFGVQVLITGLLIFFGVALVLIPAMGLIDYWANFRKLDRSDISKSEDAAALPEDGVALPEENAEALSEENVAALEDGNGSNNGANAASAGDSSVGHGSDANNAAEDTVNRDAVSITDACKIHDAASNSGNSSAGAESSEDADGCNNASDEAGAVSASSEEKSSGAEGGDASSSSKDAKD